MFVKKNGLFRPAGGEITFQVSDGVSPVINTSYAVGMQTERYLLNNYGRRLKNENTNPIRKPSTLGGICVYPGLLRRYAMQTGRFIQRTAESPAAAWYFFFLSHEIFAQSAKIS